jgi:hypothetical protein
MLDTSQTRSHLTLLLLVCKRSKQRPESVVKMFFPSLQAQKAHRFRVLVLSLLDRRSSSQLKLVPLSLAEVPVSA